MLTERLCGATFLRCDASIRLRDKAFAVHVDRMHQAWARVRIGCVAGAVFLVAAAGCKGDVSSGEMPPPAPVVKPVTPIGADKGALRRRDGKQVLLRGVNARVAGVFDVSFDDGRAPLEAIPDFTIDDARLARALGFDVLRLPVNWSALEPMRGGYRAAYLDRIAQVVDACRAAGIWVLLDMHQDAYSKEIGEDGAPLWAIQPPPDQLLGGPLTDLGERRTSTQVLRAFKGFFEEDRNSLQSVFADAAAHVLARFDGDEQVIGLEIYNEPLTTQAALDAFHVKVAGRLRAVSKKIVAFEPNSIRNFVDSAPIAVAPFPVENALYAPHVYTLAFGDPKNELASLTPERLARSVENARDEAAAWGTPLLIGELGIAPDATNWDRWIQYEYEAQDAVLASSTFWVWKEESQGSWGLFDKTNGAWTLRTAYAQAVSRAYVQAAGGDLVSMKVATNGGKPRVSLSIAYEVRRRDGVDPIDEVYVPELFAGGAFALCCDGKCTSGALVPPRDPATGIVRVSCGTTGSHTIELKPAGGP